jgi:phospho-N-acetylmuramoyl-pentapeptide-transferase
MTTGLGSILIAGLGSLLICMFLGPKFIEEARQREFGQLIREEGPEGHHAKAGTPTMGGILIFVAVTVPYLILSDYDAVSLSVWGIAIACAGLGFIDDYIKLTKRRSLGLSGRWKLVMQALLSIALWYGAKNQVHLPDILQVRIFDAQIDLGIFYPLLIFLVLAGASNGVNLTDGLDGLAAGCAAIVFLAYTAMTVITGGQEDLALLSACFVGACVGFLWFNSFPAGVFMGDTGSLGLGGGIAAMAPPNPSDPVSPMNTEAGNELNHRKPTHAPTRHAAARARENSPVVKVIAMYASRTIAVVPAARPSSPSVRFTALVVPAITRYSRTGKKMPTSTLASTKRSRTEVEMPAFWSATHHRPSEISTRHTSFVRP